MAISLKLEHVKRYRDIARLLIKYGRSDLVRSLDLDALGEPVAAAGTATTAKAEELTRDLERMGPTFIKLGQLLSSRPDVLPLPYVEALSRLQDDVEPFPYADVERIVVEELGVRMSKAFAAFDPEPIAAASLGQVHRAELRDGRPVAVKVQRPDVRRQVAEDLEALEQLAAFFDRHTSLTAGYDLSGIVDEFRKSLQRELDYRQEAHNLTTLGENLREFRLVYVPQPVDDYTTSRVLTMDFVRGRKLTAISPLEQIDLDGSVLAAELFRAYLKQILVDGFFHADPHPGNVLLTPDHRIALIDLGMTARLAPALQEKLLKLLLVASEGRAEECAQIAADIGEQAESFDRRAFQRQVSEIVSTHQGKTIEQVDVGKLLLQVAQAGSQCGMRVPQELTLLGKTLLNLGQVGRTLDPQFDVNAAIQRDAAEILRQRMFKNLSPTNLFSSLLELRELVSTLPGRIGRILDRLANDELSVKVHAFDEKRLIDGFQKVANRITMGLVLAAMIVAGALLTRVPTEFRIMGYPGLAMLLFLGAMAGGVVLLLQIALRDEKPDR